MLDESGGILGVRSETSSAGSPTTKYNGIALCARGSLLVTYGRDH
jgi:hypothetical protein